MNQAPQKGEFSASGTGLVHSKGKTLTPVANGFQRTIYTKKESGIPFVYTYYQRVILRSEHF